MRKNMKKLWLNSSIFAMAISCIAGAVSLAPAVEAFADANYTLTFDMPTAREDYAESSKMSTDYLLNATQTIAYQSEKVYAGNEAFVITEVAGTTSGQATVNTHTRGPIASWDANKKYTVSFMAQGSPFHFYFDHAGPVLLDDWVRPSASEWTYYEFTFTPSEVKAEPSRYSFLFKVAENHGKTYIDDFFIEEYQAPTTSTVTVGSAIGALPALDAGKAWAVGSEMITADTVWNYTENKTATIVDTYTLTFGEAEAPSAKEDYAESSKIGTGYLNNSVQTIEYQTQEVYAGTEALVITETAGTTSGQAILNTHSKGPITSWDANTKYTVSFMVKGSPFHMYFDHTAMTLLDDWIRPSATEWTYYEFSFTPSEIVATPGRYSFLFKVAENYGKTYIDNFFIEEYQESAVLPTLTVANGCVIGELPAVEDGKAWAIDGEVITADTVYDYTENKTATAVGAYTLTFAMPSVTEDWAESSKMSKDYLLDGTQTIGYQTEQVYAGNDAFVITEVVGTTSGQAIVNTHIKGPITSWDANKKYTVSFMVKGSPFHIYFDHAGPVLLDDWVRPSATEWTYYEYTFTPSEVKNGATPGRYSFLIKVAENYGKTYIDNFFIEEYKTPTTLMVAEGKAIGALPTLPNDYYWAIDGEIITAETIYNYTENKTATAVKNVYYTVTVDGVAQTVKANGYAVEPATPTKAEDEHYTYTFDNWYIVNTNTVFNFSTAITQNYNVEARFTATAKTQTIEPAWSSGNFEPNVDGTAYTRIRLNTSGLAWTAGVSGSTDEQYLAYTKLNGRTIKEINDAASANGCEELIKVYVRNASTFSFYGIYIPNTFTEILAEDVYTVTVLAGWQHQDSGTGNTYMNSNSTTWYFRDKTFQQNTGVNKDINASADFTFGNQGDQGNGATCFILNTKDLSNLWTKTNGTICKGNPLLNWIYINGKSVKDWNALAQASVDAGTATDICYGSTHAQNTNAGAPIAVRPGYANSASNGAFIQIWIANEFLAAADIYSFEFKAGFSFMFTGTNDVYYMSEGVKFENVNGAWVNSQNIFTVTVEDYNGTVLDTQLVVKGNYAKAVAEPSRPETSTSIYTFIGWKDSDGNDFSFATTKITGDITVIAQYEEQTIRVETTEIESIKFLYTTATDNWLIFTITNHDYTCEIQNTTYVVSAEELNRIGFSQNIILRGTLVVGSNTVEEATLAEILAANGAGTLINYWGNGTFGVRVRKTPAYDSIEKIIVNAGTHFPSYAYACNGDTNDVRYMVVSQQEFIVVSVSEGSNGTSGTTSYASSISGYDIVMADGASIRIAKVNGYDGSEDYMETEGYKESGIRFQTMIAISSIEQLQAYLGNLYESVEFGTLIATTTDLLGGSFTHNWLEANGVQYMDIVSTAWLTKDGYAFAYEKDDYVTFFGSVVDLKPQNYSRGFSGIGYIKITTTEGEVIYYYAPYSAAYSRSAAYVAQAAIADRSETQKEGYDHRIDANNNWSPYTVSELAFLELYLGTLAETEIAQQAFTLTSNGKLATDANARNTGTLTVNKKLNGAYVQLRYQTNIDVWGKFYYQNAAGTKTAVEDFYLQKGTFEHKQYLDLFRKNGVGKLAGLTAEDLYLSKITLQNATVDMMSTGTFRFLGLYSAAKTIDTANLQVYVTSTLTNGGEMTLGAHLGLGGALTYLAKSGIYEGVTSGSYGKGSVLMRTSTQSFVEQRNANWLGTSKEAGYYGHGTSSKPGDGAVNLINNYDVGRQIQQSWYANVGGSSTANTGANGYTRLQCDTGNGGYWPYNPVQAGDCNDNPSQIIDYEVNEEKGYIYVKARAMDWAYGDTSKGGVKNGVTTKSYMENYYRLNDDGTVFINNSFIDWNGFTDMDKCDFHLSELPAFIPVHTLNHFITYDGTNPWANEALTIKNDLSIWTESTGKYYQSRIDRNANGTTGEEWVAWANDQYGSIALGIYIPNITRFVSGRYETAVTTALDSNVNAKSNRLSSKGLMSNMQPILRTYQSCYVGNTSYTAPGIELRMEEYKTIDYTYVLSVNDINTVRSQFKEIHDSGKVTNAGNRQGDKVGLDSWARADKMWTQI